MELCPPRILNQNRRPERLPSPLHLPLRWLIIVFLSLGAFSAQAATLSLEPGGGSFLVGATFEVRVLLDSHADPVNALDIALQFPPDKLQLVSPSTGQSIISLWTSQPSFNNQTGTANLQGLIPNGITTSRGVVTTLVFRARNPGQAYVTFTDKTRVLKNDGLGTDILSGNSGAVFTLLLPPPNGPIVASETHPDPSFIYKKRSLLVTWAPDGDHLDGYSYMLSDNSVDEPDDIMDGKNTQTMYENLTDGTHFFHIKALRGDHWGGTTHFSATIDATPPADFPINILPGTTIAPGPAIIEFGTTDGYSGIGHYEIKVIKTTQGDGDQNVFVEAMSPYITPTFDEGKYDVIVRAYDKAGNFVDETERFTVRAQLFGLTGEGVSVGSSFMIPWLVVLVFLIALTFSLCLLVYLSLLRHRRMQTLLAEKKLPMATEAGINALAETKKKYVTIVQSVLLAVLIIGGGVHTSDALADTSPLPPPVITTISKNIGNDEIFYAAGSAPQIDSTVVLHIQDLTTGSVTNEETVVDRKGEWFYRHTSFLSPGEYAVWTQLRIGKLESPPSPQETVTVSRTAFQIGSSRFSHTFIYGIATGILLVVVLILITIIVVIEVHVRRNRVLWIKEVREAEESVRRGFAVLKRDIEAELAVVRRMKMTKELRAEEVGREEELLKDLAWAERYIEKEVFDIEKTQN